MGIDNKKTTILPNNETHYRGVHNKKYLINILSERPNIKGNTNNTCC
jgi:hypothetical protein